ncbi:Peptidase S8/S53 domain containing protein [Rhypophila sp. PSN 637]
MSYDNKGQVILPSHVSHISSRGPTISSSKTHANIIKPDIVAPGVAIYSAKSASTITKPEHGVPPSPDPNPQCLFMTGTSMAAPVVSGAAAVLREALAQTGVPNLSVALIKALIINGAVDLHKEGGMFWQGNPTTLGGSGDTKVVKIGPAPNDIQGWGRLDIAASVENVVAKNLSGLVDIRLKPGVAEDSDLDPRLKPDQTPIDFHAWEVLTEPPRRENKGKKANIRATLAWSDLSGAGLMNCLALSLVFKDATRQGKNIAVNRNSTDPVLKRMGNNNIQRLEINDIDFAGGTNELVVNVTVTEVDTIWDAERDALGLDKLKARQAYAVCWKVWYA